jgi:hypothetical protein
MRWASVQALGECVPASFLSRLIRSINAASRGLLPIRASDFRLCCCSHRAEPPRSNGLNFNPCSRGRSTITGASSSWHDRSGGTDRRILMFISTQRRVHRILAHRRCTVSARQGPSASGTPRFSYSGWRTILRHCETITYRIPRGSRGWIS